MKTAAARDNENARAAALELGLDVETMNAVYETYFDLARTLESHACALAIIRGDLPNDPGLIKKVVVSDHQKNRIIRDALYRRWFPKCRTVTQLTEFLSTLDPQRRYMRAAYVRAWCATYLDDSVPLPELIRLAHIAPQGSDEDERLIGTIFRLAGPS